MFRFLDDRKFYVVNLMKLWILLQKYSSIYILKWSSPYALSNCIKTNSKNDVINDYYSIFKNKNMSDHVIPTDDNEIQTKFAIKFKQTFCCGCDKLILNNHWKAELWENRQTSSPNKSLCFWCQAIPDSFWKSSCERILYPLLYLRFFEFWMVV